MRELEGKCRGETPGPDDEHIITTSSWEWPPEGEEKQSLNLMAVRLLLYSLILEWRICASILYSILLKSFKTIHFLRSVWAEFPVMSFGMYSFC